jgi:hypothetical protein
MPKLGRPRKPPTRLVSFRLPLELWQTLYQIAASDDRPIASVVARIVRDRLAARN